jgi:hypothetical protein
MKNIKLRLNIPLMMKHSFWKVLKLKGELETTVCIDHIKVGQF